MNICNNCKHCKKPFKHSEHTYEYECKLNTSVNHITGDTDYERCRDINTDGNCERYKDNFITKLKKMIGL